MKRYALCDEERYHFIFVTSNIIIKLVFRVEYFLTVIAK